MMHLNVKRFDGKKKSCRIPAGFGNMDY